MAIRTALLTVLILLGGVSAAHADLTAFIGVNGSPSNRLTKGFAAGFGLVIVGFEFEFADTNEDADAAAPGQRTGMANGYLQTPFPIAGFQFYGTIGGGLYRERLLERQETHFGVNTGGGVKITLAGPLRLRLDYRLLTLQGDPLHSRVHRFYSGLNLAF